MNLIPGQGQWTLHEETSLVGHNSGGKAATEKLSREHRVDAKTSTPTNNLVQL